MACDRGACTCRRRGTHIGDTVGSVKNKRFINNEFAEAFTKERKIEMLLKIGQIPYLYDKKHSLYKNAHMKKEKWARLSSDYGMHNMEKYWTDTLKKFYLSAKKAYIKEFGSSESPGAEFSEDWTASQKKAYKDFKQCETNKTIQSFMVHVETSNEYTETRTANDLTETRLHFGHASPRETDCSTPEQLFNEMTSTVPYVVTDHIPVEPVLQTSSDVSRESMLSGSTSPNRKRRKRHQRKTSLTNTGYELQTLLACADKYANEPVPRYNKTIGRLLGDEVEAAYAMSPKHRQIQFKSDIQALITANEKAIFKETL